MRYEVALTSEADTTSREHLLQHYNRNVLQEDLCFALWRLSTGGSRRTALIDQVLLPKEKERTLHGNASFEPSYVSRVIGIARERKVGLAFMHSHPSSGWQGMSSADIVAEQDVLAYPAGATGLPLVGLTIGTDGYWSARFWERHQKKMRRTWCTKVRVVGEKTYKLHYNDHLDPTPIRKNVLKRTYDTWGQASQNTISRLRVGIVGLGSVGCFVAEAMARIGVSRVTLIDPDKIEEHNLDRLLYGNVKNIGKKKVTVVSRALRRNATSKKIKITAIPTSVHEHNAYLAALDCDIIFSCVDKPIPRDVLNYIAQAHLVPVIDGGIAVETDIPKDELFSAHWRAHLVTPYHQCMRCSKQYSSSAVIMELDGSLDDPSYVSNLPTEEKPGNQNVFPFSQSVASMEVNLMLRYLLAKDWWPNVHQQDYQFMTGETRVINNACHPNCTFRGRRSKGDIEKPFYLINSQTKPLKSPIVNSLYRLVRTLCKVVFWRA